VGLRLTGVALIGRSNGQRAWTLQAGQAESTRTRDRLSLSGGVEVATLARGGIEEQVRVKAPSALYDIRSKKFLVEAGATATVREQGQLKAVLRTPRTSYGLAEKRLRATGGIHATLHESGRPRATLVAPELDYALDKKVLQVKGGFTATLLPRTQADRPATLSGPDASWNEATQLLLCPSGATLTRGTLVNETASLKADLKRGIYSSVDGSGSFHLDEIVKELVP
jgi:hypothetical protein